MNTCTVMPINSKDKICSFCKQSLTSPGCITTGLRTTDGRLLMSHIIWND